MMGDISNWLPYVMLLVLGVGIVLDSLYLARRDRKWAEEHPEEAAMAGMSATEAEWHRQNRAMINERAWHEHNRKLLADKGTSSSAGRPAAPVSAAPSPGSALVSERPRATLWRPWLVLTSLIILSGIVFWLFYPHLPVDALQAQ